MDEEYHVRDLDSDDDDNESGGAKFVPLKHEQRSAQTLCMERDDKDARVRCLHAARYACTGCNFYYVVCKKHATSGGHPSCAVFAQILRTSGSTKHASAAHAFYDAIATDDAWRRLPATRDKALRLQVFVPYTGSRDTMLVYRDASPDDGTRTLCVEFPMSARNQEAFAEMLRDQFSAPLAYEVAKRTHVVLTLTTGENIRYARDVTSPRMPLSAYMK